MSNFYYQNFDFPKARMLAADVWFQTRWELQHYFLQKPMLFSTITTEFFSDTNQLRFSCAQCKGALCWEIKGIGSSVTRIR